MAKNKRNPLKRFIFTVYPPNKKFNYYHYKHGFKAWKDCDPMSKFTLAFSVISLVIIILKKI